VNIVETRHKVFPILGEAIAFSRSKNNQLISKMQQSKVVKLLLRSKSNDLYKLSYFN